MADGLHIGLIGGIGPAATGFYYRKLVNASKAANVPFRMTITHADNSPLVENFLAGRREEQAVVFAGHISELEAAGADVAAITALAGHYCIEETMARASIPIANAIDAIRSDLAARGLHRVGVLGSGRVMSTGLFGALSDVQQLSPPPDQLEAVGQAYIAMAQRSHCTDEDRMLFFSAGRAMMDKGAEAIFLAGTDLFMAFEGYDPGYPVIDGGEVHIAELARLAAGREAA